MKRKILSLVLVAAMLASLLVFVPTAGATESKATVETTNAVACVGDEVTVDVKVTSTEEIIGYSFAFEYDSSRLTYKGITYPTFTIGEQEGVAGNSANLDANPAWVQWTQNGPYRSFSYVNPEGISVDASAGYVIATLKFAVKTDAPLGDALVAIRNLHGESSVDTSGYYYTAKITNANGAFYGDEMTFITSNVTVLPEGYLTEGDSTAFEITDGVLEAYNGDADVVVIPSDVTTIANGAMDGISASKIIIPATVETVENAAIANCENLTAVYVLGAETALGEYSIGWYGTPLSTHATGFRRGQAYLTSDGETPPITVVYGKTGSTAETYGSTTADDDGFTLSWAESDIYTLTYNGNSYYVASDAKAPGTMVIDGKKVVGWNDGTKTYAAGTTMALTGDATLTPVTVTAPVTNTAVDFKLAAYEKGNASSDLAFRFTANFSQEDYKEMEKLGTVSVGMLITPAKYISKAGSFTKEALNTLGAANGAYIDIDMEGGFYDTTTTDYVFAGSIKNFSAATLAKNPNFAAVLYVTVETADKETFTLYGDFNFEANQNVKNVANTLANSTTTQLGDTQKGWLAALVSAFTNED